MSRSVAPTRTAAKAKEFRRQLETQIEALKDAQAELEASRHGYVDLYDFAPVTYLTLNQKGWITQINLTGTGLFGKDRPTLLNTPLSSYVAKADQPPFLAYLSRFQQGSPKLTCEVRIQRTDGTQIPVQITSSWNPETNLYRSILTDLSERKEAELTLQKANQDLESQVRLRTEALLRTNSSLEQEMAYRKQLQDELLNVSENEKKRIGDQIHDGLCQSIAAALMMSSVLAKNLELVSNPHAKTAQEINALLNSILIDAKEVARGLDPVHLDSAGLMVALQQLAKIVGRSISCEFECPRKVLVADNAIALNLYRIAQEIIAHWIKHASPRCIVISLKRTQAKVLLAIRHDGKRKSGKGLALIKYRAKMIGALLTLSNGKTGGRVLCSIKA